MKVSSLLLSMASLCLAVGMAGEVKLIPQPKSVQEVEGNLSVDQIGKIEVGDPSLKGEASFLSSLCKEGTLKVNLVLNKSLQPEGYKLVVSPKGILIEGGSKAGVFYGVQSLLQLAERGKGEIPLCTVEDESRYPWRGYMVDESRHFFGKEKMKQTLEMMARYKMNKLHWHLTDEPAWRVEIKKYPRLTSVGGSGTWSDPDVPVQFYTQKELKEIIDYAAKLHIEVIPEIDMPGHATAANRAYPELSGGGVPEHPHFTFNPGKEKVYEVLSDVMKEVAQVFPSKYMHIGGDEVAFGIEAWKTDPDVQALMKKEGFTNVREAEGYFIKRMTGVINQLDKELIGWDELLDLKADPSKTTIMWWRHDRVPTLKKSLENNYKTILCPRRPLYFDFIQHGSHKWGRQWSGFCPIQDIYAFPDSGLSQWKLTPEHEKNIIGMQANLWTERIQNKDRFDFMTYPRLAALAESAWSDKDVKKFEDFEQRMDHEYALYKKMGLRYFNHKDPDSTPEPAGCERKNKKTSMDFRD